jgi:hypothetical protein
MITAGDQVSLTQEQTDRIMQGHVQQEPQGIGDVRSKLLCAVQDRRQSGGRWGDDVQVSLTEQEQFAVAEFGIKDDRARGQEVFGDPWVETFVQMLCSRNPDM